MKRKRTQVGKKIASIVLASATVMSIMPVSAVMAEDVNEAKVNGTKYKTINEAWDKVKDGGTIDILKDCKPSSRLVVNEGKSVTVNMNGHSVNRHLASIDSSESEKNGEVFCVNNEATLTINGGDKNIKHGGYVAAGAKEDGVWYEQAGHDGAPIYGGVIVGGYSTNGGGGIHMKKKSTVTLNDVTIAGNKADYWGGDGNGGGVAMDGSNSSLTLNNSKIIYNYAESDGGGVYANSGYNNITLNNNSEISHNWAEDDYGGGIYLDDDHSKVVLNSGCKINNNKATYGGGIYCADDYMTIRMNGEGDKEPAISENIATKKGGGIYFDYSKVSVKGGKFKNNDSQGGGGGAIYLQHNSNRTSKDSAAIANITCTGNKGAGDGGAIHSEQEYVSVDSCTITGNWAKDHGGGIYIYNDDNSISSSTITGNSAGKGGGGVYTDSTETVALGGKLIIKDNTVNNKANNYEMKKTISSSPSSGSQVGITADLGVIGEVGHYAQNVFFSDVDGRYVEWNDADRQLYLKEGNKDTKVDSASADVEKVTKEGKEVLKGTFSYPSLEDTVKDLDGTFYYTDTYFKDPGRYNNHLATMSLCMAMSAFNSNVGNDNKNGTDYVLKSKNIVKLLSDIGVSRDNIYLSNTYTVKPGTGTIGVAIGQKGLDNEGHILVPIAVRGAGYESEWTSNVTIGNGTKDGEHAGFADAANQVMAQVKSYISNYNLEQAVREGKVKFWVTGYSRAGATANLTARRLIDEYGTNNEVYAYCMEAPQGALSDTTDKSKYNIIHNCINYSDPVPKVAPSFMNFMRYGTDERFNDPGTSTTKVKKQLHAVAPDLAYDDYYVIGTLDLFSESFLNLGTGKNPNMIKPVFKGYLKDAAPKDAGKFTDELISKLGEWAIKDRNAFTTVNEDPNYDLRDNTNLEKVSFEKSLQLVMPIVFSKSDKELDELIEVASERANDLDTIHIYFGPILGKWEKQTTAKKKEWIWDELWYKVVETKEGNGISTKLTSRELTDLKTAWPTLLDTVFTFVSKDYNYTGWVDGSYMGTYDYTVSGLNVLGTLVYNSSSLIQAHYPEINYAWLRSMDTYYANDTSPIKVSNDKTPTVVYSLDKSTYEGDQTLKLNTKDSAEKAGIYYRLTTTVAGGTETISSWMPYNNGITLPVVTDNNGTQKTVTYKVETRAAYCNNKSETTSKTYTINPVTRHSVKVTDADASEGTEALQSYNYAKGEKVTINVTEQTGKFFAGWSSDDITLTKDEQGKKTITFTMPDKDVVLKATYKNLIDTVEVTELQNPVAGKAFVSDAKSTLKGNGEEVEAQKPCDVIWTTINANGEHENVKTQNAGYNTKYEAILVLRPEEGIREFADKMNVSVNDTSIGEQTVTPQADGSIWVYCGAITTGKAKFKSTQTIAITAKTGTQIADLGLPSNILIDTDDGFKIATVTGWNCDSYESDKAGTYDFSANIDLDACGIDPADETKPAVVKAKVTLEGNAKAVTPVLSQNSVTPGTYKEKENIYLETATSGATIMYTVNDGDEQKYNSDTGIELTVPENAKSGEETDYIIKAYAKADGMDDSDSVSFEYKIVKPYTVTISYTDTGFEGSKWSKSPTTTTYLPGETAYIIAPEEADEQFEKWEADENSGITISTEDATSKLIKVDSINKDINLTAVYNPIVKKINLTIPKPATGEKLAKTVSSCSATITETYDVLNDFKKVIPITWTPEGNDGTALAYQSYTAKMSMNMDNAKGKFFVSDQLELTVNGEKSQSWAIEQKDGKDVLVVYATFAPTAKVKAVSVAQPDSVQVGHGTQKEDILQKLAKKKVLVNLADGTTTEAAVTWTEVVGYNADTLAEQKITATGTIALPEYVDGTGINLNVTADVYVAGAERVKTPVASVDSGVYNNAVSVTLSTDTEGATIYYTTDGSEPATSVTGTTQMYNGTPITMNGEVSTLNAIAVKGGMQESSISSSTYYIHTHVDADGDGKCDGIYTGNEDEKGNRILEKCDAVLLGRSNDAEGTATSVPGTIVQDDGKGTIYVEVNGEDIVEKADDKNDVEGRPDTSTSESEDTKKEAELSWKYSNDVYPTTKLTYAYKPEGSDESVTTTPHNYIFAGWYKAEDKEVKDADGNTKTETVMTAYDKMPTETAYAKFVDATVLSVKAQVTKGTNKDSQETNMRFLTTIDDIDYQFAGFKITFGDKKKEYQTKKVYEKVLASANGEVVASKPKETMGNNVSKYFMALTIINIKQDLFYEEFKVTPYWVTADGTRVYAQEVSKKVCDAPDFNK